MTHHGTGESDLDGDTLIMDTDGDTLGTVGVITQVGDILVGDIQDVDTDTMLITTTATEEEDLQPITAPEAMHQEALIMREEITWEENMREEVIQEAIYHLEVTPDEAVTTALTAEAFLISEEALL